MPVYALGDLVPEIDPTAFVHPDAVVIGNVRIGAESSIWPGAVLRGDGAGIVVGARTSIQDGSVLHCTDDLTTVVGDDCVVGHLVHLEGCTIEDNALVGSGSVVLHNAVVRSWSLVGANAVLPDNFEVPSRTMALGVPATIREREPAPEAIRGGAQSYVQRARRYADELRRID
jgi:carbonic anhydrase/acetyltransferase-like protein (isoleucine patch superfamily)